jgi:hypothetical protein
MTAFTWLGVVMFWMLCWQIGELIAKAIHLRSLTTALLDPVQDELDAAIAVMSGYLKHTHGVSASGGQEVPPKTPMPPA